MICHARLRCAAFSLLLTAGLTACPDPKKDAPTPPTLTLSTDHLAFGPSTAGALPPASQTVAVSFTGGGTTSSVLQALTYVGAPTGWLEVGSSGTGPLDMVIRPTTTALPVGTHEATIEVSASGAASRTVTVSFTVAADTVNPVVAVDKASLSFTAAYGGSSPASQEITLSNAGTGTLAAATVSDDATWLSASVVGSVVTVQPSITGLAPGAYAGTVTINVPNAVPASLVIPVSLLVTRPTIALSQPGAAFRTPSGTRPALTLTVSNSGTGTLAPPVVASSSPWLQGTVSGAASPYTVLVQVDASTLVAGTYAGTLTIASPGASNTPQAFPVSLVVDPVPIAPSKATAGGAAALVLDALLAKFVDCVKAGAPYEAQLSGAFDEMAAQYQASLDAGRVDYDAGQVDACYAAITGTTCDEAERLVHGGPLPPACEAVFTGKVPNGQACGWNEDCASGWCDESTPCAFRCGAKKADGQACYGWDAECLSGACGWVSGVGMQCMANVPGALDQPCGEGWPECQAGLYCTVISRVCKAELVEGASCMEDDDCQEGLACNPYGDCQRLVAVGASCASGLCGDGAYCSPAAGMRCVDIPWRVNDSCAETGVCHNLYCNTAHVCVAGTVPPGGTCGGGSSRSNAVEPYCADGSYCSSLGNVCVPSGSSSTCP